MRTVQVSLNETLVEEVDETVRRLGTSRSAFTRLALRQALDRLRTETVEQKHRDGYKRRPVRRSDVEDWEEEQVWTA